MHRTLQHSVYYAAFEGGVEIRHLKVQVVVVLGLMQEIIRY